MKINVAMWSKDERRTLGLMADALDGKLTLAENVAFSTVTATVAAADSPVSVSHRLGRRPTAYFWMVDRPAIVYHTQSDEDAWTEQTVTFRCSVSGTVARLILL